MGTTITKKDSMVHIEFGDGSGIIMAANDKAVPKENTVQRGLEELRRHVDKVNEIRGKEIKTWDDLLADEALAAEVAAKDFVPPKQQVSGGTQTEHGILVPSDLADLEVVFTDFLDNTKKFLDLGSGLGDVVEYALTFEADAWGAEIVEEFYNKSKVKERIYNVDFFTIDLSPYNVVYYYLAGCARERELVAWLNANFTGHAIFYDQYVDEGTQGVFYGRINDSALVRKFPNGRVYTFSQ